jgi:hypothetical protein
MKRITGPVLALRLALGAALGALFVWLFDRGARPETERAEPPSKRAMFRQARAIQAQGQAGHETRDLNTCGIAAFGCLFVVAMAVVLVFTTGVFSLLSGKPPAVVYPPLGLDNAPPPTLPSETRLEAVPAQNYQEFLAKEQEILHSYGWVNKDAGTVRIPIERAMELIVSRGLPARPPADGQQFTDNGNQIPSESSSGRFMEELYR